MLCEVNGIIDHVVNVGRARGERVLSGEIQQIPYDVFGAINCCPNLIEKLLVAFPRILFGKVVSAEADNRQRILDFMGDTGGQASRRSASASDSCALRSSC